MVIPLLASQGLTPMLVIASLCHGELTANATTLFLG